MQINHKIAIAIAAFAICTSGASAQKSSSPSVLNLSSSITDNSIVYPESFENDAQRLLEGWYMRNYTSLDPNQPDKGNPVVSDEEIQRRLANLPTVIEMPFNQIVRAYIDRYTEKSRPQVGAILGLGSYYIPIFEQALEERGLPNELKYLPVIESGLDPNAVSKHGAAGLWQFMLGTAKGLGMEVNSLVDERRDPYLSSKAAADYLKSLHDTYSDWSLAIAAYNCGPTTVNKAIRRAGGDPQRQDFWSIYEYLSPETRGYVPMFIAANYVMNYYPQHRISPVLPTKPLVTDTIHVSDRVHFNQISAVLDIPVEELRLLNPQYRADVIPGSADKNYTLILPSRQVQAYIMSREDILAYEAEKYARRETAEPGDEAPASEELQIVTTQMPIAEKPAVAFAEPETKPAAVAPPSQTSVQTLTHKVASGETLASIARKYGVSASEIRTWNHLRRNAVRTGQTLKIQKRQAVDNTPSSSPRYDTASQQKGTSSKNQQANAKSKQTKSKKQAAPATTDHEIKSGESLTSLSKKYGVSIDEIKAANGMKNDDLRAGNNIKIPTKGSKVSNGSGKSKKSGSAKSSSKKKSGKKRRR